MSNKKTAWIFLICFIIALAITIILTAKCVEKETQQKQVTEEKVDSTYTSQGHISNLGRGGH